MRISRVTQCSMVAIAVMVMVLLTLTVSGKGTVQAVEQSSVSWEKGVGYAESSDMPNLLPPVVSLRGYDLEPQFTLGNGSTDPASSLTVNDIALIFVVLFIVIALSGLSRFIGRRVVQHKRVSYLSSWKGQAPETLG